MIHGSLAFLARKALFVVNVPHGNHLLGFKDLAVAPGAGVVGVSALNTPGLDNGTVQELWLRASATSEMFNRCNTLIDITKAKPKIHGKWKCSRQKQKALMSRFAR